METETELLRVFSPTTEKGTVSDLSLTFIMFILLKFTQ